MKDYWLKVVLVFVIFVLFSPWLVVELLNYPQTLSERRNLLDYMYFVDETNILQNQAKERNLGILGRVIVNKYVVLSKEFLQRYFESYDPKFLFFEGDLHISKSIRSSGALYLALLPMIVFGLFRLIENEKFRKGKTKWAKRITLILLILAPILPGFLLVHYETILRTPFLLILTLIASIGFMELIEKKNLLVYFLIFILVFELLRFYHNFYLHYPRYYEWIVKDIRIGPKI